MSTARCEIGYAVLVQVGPAPLAKRLLTQWETEGRVESFERKPADGAGRPTIAYKLAPLGRR